MTVAIITGVTGQDGAPFRPGLDQPRATALVTADAVAKLNLGKLDVLELGNLEARRDGGFAKKHVEGMWRMLQADRPGHVRADRQPPRDRPEIGMLTGNPAKAKAKLGWAPRTTLEQLCRMMGEADLRRHEWGVSL